LVVYHLQVQSKKAMEINDADVSELVDARDLKCLATLESSRLFGKRDFAFGINVPERAEIGKQSFGPRMTLTVHTLLTRATEACPLQMVFTPTR
jgi:hypothetical protein